MLIRYLSLQLEARYLEQLGLDPALEFMYFDTSLLNKWMTKKILIKHFK